MSFKLMEQIDEEGKIHKYVEETKTKVREETTRKLWSKEQIQEEIESIIEQINILEQRKVVLEEQTVGISAVIKQ